MRNRTGSRIRAIITLVVLGFGLGTAPLARAADPAELDRLRTIFTNELAKIAGDSAGALKVWPGQYIRDLETLRASLQQAGDLEGWHAVENEVARFKKTSALADPAPTAPTALQDLMTRYRGRPGEVELDKARRTVDLSRKYMGRLETAQSDLTKANRMSDALAYNTEIKRVNALPEITSAEFVLATEASLKPATATPPPPAPTPASPAPTPVPAVKPATPARADEPPPEGVRISEGASAPAIPGLTFKTLTVTPSDRMKLTRKLSGQIMMASESEMRRETSSYYYYSSSSKSGSMHHFLRVGLRAGSTAFMAPGCRLLVEFYGREIGGASGKIDPKPVGSQFIKLPELNAQRWVFVDLPPVSLQSSTYKSSGYYYTMGSTYKSGMEFYGAVISVFDGDNNLIYQSVTAPMLGTMAPAELPAGMLRNSRLETARQRMEAAQASYRTAQEAYMSTPGTVAQAAYRAATEELNAAREAYNAARREGRE